jgi:endonuclease/exonuclease/phosphatase family metal-dependent hydrolase
VTVGKAYRALTWNVGYGANDSEFSFFMAEGRTVAGDGTKGLMSHAESEKSVKNNIGAVTSMLEKRNPDIALLQEVDKDAGRSFHYNEYEAIAGAFAENRHNAEISVMDAYATNFHTGWLVYPPTRPLGRVVDSGVLTLSRYMIDSAVRRSLPVDGSFPAKYFDLDRCFTVARIPVKPADGGSDADSDAVSDGEQQGDLVVINVHLSGYDAGLKMRGEQMKLLAETMKQEYENGNWVIAGGDWSQCFEGSIDAFKGRMEVPKWAVSIGEGALPDGFAVVGADNADIVTTCRDTSIPWTAGISYETITDGWIVSDNISATAENIDTEYKNTSHNPVALTFRLK